MEYSLNNKKFTSLENTANGEVGADTVFHYHQEGDIISADYAGGSIVKGHLLGNMLADGTLDFRYHHINADGVLMLGQCRSTPQLLPDGRLQFHEKWQWLSGDKSAGESIIVEIASD